MNCDTLDRARRRASSERICRQARSQADRPRARDRATGGAASRCIAAQHYGCHVTTTTISREQHARASERVLAEGLGAHVDLLLEDYR